MILVLDISLLFSLNDGDNDLDSLVLYDTSISFLVGCFVFRNKYADITDGKNKH